jgi:hypothetical protein
MCRGLSSSSSCWDASAIPKARSGIELHVLYTHSFEVRVGKTVTTFRPSKEQNWILLRCTRKESRIEYGVMTHVERLDIAHEYFGTPAE